MNSRRQHKLTIFGKSIRILGHSIPLVAVGGIVAGGIAVAALLMGKNRADRIVMNLNPQPMTPMRPSLLTGRFEDKEGKPVKIRMGRFLVIMKQPGGQEQPVRGGVIGPNVSDFSVQIDTRGLPVGAQYEVKVWDNMVDDT